MKKRDSNFELLRVISMFLIVLYHVILHGHTINHCQIPIMKNILQIILYISIVHVNSFVLVTGYYQSKSNFNKKKVISILGTAIFYMAAIILILELQGALKLSPIEVVKELLLDNTDSYWFIKTYIFLYILSPYINKLISHLTKKEYQKLLVTLTILTSIIPFFSVHKIFSNNGYTLYSFIYLYLLGAYYRKYPITKEKRLKKYSTNKLRIILLSIFLSCVLLNYGILIISNIIANHTNYLTTLSNGLNHTKYDYSNPFIVIQSIAYFLFFNTLTIKSKIINSISKLTFGVYLIHDNIFVRQRLYMYLKIGDRIIYSYKFLIYIILIAISIFIVCCLIEEIRQIISKSAKEFYKKWSWSK